MTKLPPDVETICFALELDPGYLADVFRREAARSLHEFADRLGNGGIGNDPQVKTITQLLLLIEALEREWERRFDKEGTERQSDGAVARNGGDSPTQPPHPSREGTLA